jgi:hypothetical protein
MERNRSALFIGVNLILALFPPPDLTSTSSAGTPPSPRPTSGLRRRGSGWCWECEMVGTHPIDALSRKHCMERVAGISSILFSCLGMSHSEVQVAEQFQGPVECSGRTGAKPTNPRVRCGARRGEGRGGPRWVGGPRGAPGGALEFTGDLGFSKGHPRTEGRFGNMCACT